MLGAMHRLVPLLAIVSVACSCGAGGATRGVVEGAESTPFTAWPEPGLRLERRCVTAPDLSRCHVVGIEADGSELSGRALWTRIAPAHAGDADALARRTMDVLLGHAGGSWLDADTDRERSSFVSEAEWAIVRAPSIEDGSVVFDLMEGEMHPEAMRARVHIASGAVEHQPLRELASAAAEAIGPALCAPALGCGCDVGCVRFEPVPPSAGQARFRDPRTRTLFFRNQLGWMQETADLVACDVSCFEPARGPEYACAIEGDACARTDRAE